MKVLGILGSPRRGGNSELLLDQALEGARSAAHKTEKLILNELEFSACQECGGCDKSGRCIIEDDMQTVYKKLGQSGAIILASPIFFGSLSAQTKAMIDRYQCRWVTKEVLGQKGPRQRKKGLLILVSGANREKFFKNAESIVRNLFAVLDIEFSGNLYCPNVDEKAKVSQYPDYLKQAFKLGQNIG